MKRLILKYSPVFIQNLAISIFNSIQYRKRHGGMYGYYRRYFKEYDSADIDAVTAESHRRLLLFLKRVVGSSPFYAGCDFTNLGSFPVLEKADLLSRLDEIVTVDERDAEISLTGGTTGASMKVLYTQEDIQERNAMLDHFRSHSGYKLGRRTAWFSGKDIVRIKDLKRGICYRDDLINKIRFFSTFHISQDNFDAYWGALVDFSPEYLVGFPSSVFDICMMAKDRGLKFEGVIKAFFPTAETVLPMHRQIIGDVLGCPLIDQYASSEGAPFILECTSGALHIHPLTGVFEVVDEDFNPSDEGEILVTSFSTRGTPLIRYRIGDRIKLAPKDQICSCGSVFPIVRSIDGRSSDFVWSPENGKVNLGNISNCTKEAPGIVCFQIIQDCSSKIVVKVVKSKSFTSRDEMSFLSALRSRVGGGMEIVVEYVHDIPREKSGKFRIVKNSIFST